MSTSFQSEFLKHCFLAYLIELEKQGRFYEKEKISKKFFSKYLEERSNHSKDHLKFVAGYWPEFETSGFINPFLIRKEYLILGNYILN